MSPVKIEWRQDGRLWASMNGTESTVDVKCCFPWSEPFRYISLRDDEENEFALIPTIDDLDKPSRAAVELALEEAGFVLNIETVRSIEEDFEIRVWDVVTKQGARRFQTKLDDWPLPVPGGGLIIRDVAGDLFLLKETEKMDSHSRKVLKSFVE